MLWVARAPGRQSGGPWPVEICADPDSPPGKARPQVSGRCRSLPSASVAPAYQNATPGGSKGLLYLTRLFQDALTRIFDVHKANGAHKKCSHHAVRIYQVGVIAPLAHTACTQLAHPTSMVYTAHHTLHLSASPQWLARPLLAATLDPLDHHPDVSTTSNMLTL